MADIRFRDANTVMEEDIFFTNPDGRLSLDLEKLTGKALTLDSMVCPVLTSLLELCNKTAETIEDGTSTYGAPIIQPDLEESVISFQTRVKVSTILNNVTAVN